MDKNLFIPHLKGTSEIYEDTILSFYYKYKSDLASQYNNADSFLKEFIIEFNLKPTNITHEAVGKLYTYQL